jgi:hypothetical protein
LTSYFQALQGTTQKIQSQLNSDPSWNIGKVLDCHTAANDLAESALEDLCLAYQSCNRDGPAADELAEQGVHKLAQRYLYPQKI